MYFPRSGSRPLSFLSIAAAALALASVAPIPHARAQSAAGSLDGGFTLGDVIGSGVYSIAPQSDGKVLLGGSFSSINGVPRQVFARVNADGSVDTTFREPVLESYNTRTDSTITTLDPTYIPVVQTVVPLASGKIFVGGNFYFVNGASGFGGLVRLNGDGSVDTSFNVPRFSGTVYAMVPTADGGFLVGGDFAFVGAGKTNCLVKLKSTGKVDASFSPDAFSGALAGSGSVFPAVHAVALQADGKVLIGGSFSGIGNAARPGLARLNADGSVDGGYNVDASFNPTAPGSANSSNEVLTIAVQADGKALVGGVFINSPPVGQPSGNGRNSLFRFNTDGSFDTSFNPGGSGTDGIVDAILLQNDGRIYVGGGFMQYDGTANNFFMRLLPDGTLDTQFAPSTGEGADSDVYALAFQSDGKLLLGGIFRQLEGVPLAVAGRVNTEAGAAPAVTVSITATRPKAHVGAATNQGIFTVRRVGGNLSAPLNVRYTLAGTAQNGVDYRALNGFLTIPGGSTAARIKIKPLNDPVAARQRRVILTLTPSNAYGIGSGTAVVKIIDDLVVF